MSWLSGLLGGVGGGAAGTGIGAVLGSVIPGLGTAAGAAIGGGLGGILQGGSDAKTARDLMEKMTQEQAATKAENLARYQQIIGEYGGVRDRARTLNAQMSDQLYRDIDQRYDGLNSDAVANLGARGLANTTIAPSVLAGITRERSASLARASDERLQRTIKIDTDATGELAKAIERRTDVGPSNQDIQALATAAGQAQANLGGSLKSILEEIQKLGEKPAGQGVGSGQSDVSSWLQKLLPGVYGNLAGAPAGGYYGR